MEQTRTRARCARRGQRRTQHIATKDTEEKYEEKTEKIVLRKRGLGLNWGRGGMGGGGGGGGGGFKLDGAKIRAKGKSRV